MSKKFPKEELYSLTNQLRRCVSAIPANIAEGCGKNSQKDFGNFLNIALGPQMKLSTFCYYQKILIICQEKNT